VWDNSGGSISRNPQKRGKFHGFMRVVSEVACWTPRSSTAAEGAIMVTANSSMDFVIFLGSAIFAP